MIVDDDAAIRFGLRRLVEAMGAEVVAEADSGQRAIEEVTKDGAELVLLDVSMPNMGDFRTARKLRELKPQLKIILISQYSDHVYAEEALQMGMNGYVLKRNAGRDLEEAFEAVQSGQTFVSPYITERKRRVKAAP
jgi:DNA-binding NarL/FixJ family response regulator